MPLQSTILYKSGSERRNKLQTKTSDQASKKLDDLIHKSGQIIFETKSVFPFTLTPNKVIICPNRVTISYGGVILKDELPMMVENITGAEATQGLFFSTLSIDTFGIPKPNPIRFLKKIDARLARRYILALIECKKNGIDLNNYPLKILKEKLKEIGRVQK